MQESITLIEKEINDKHQAIKLHCQIRDKLIQELSANETNKIHLENVMERLQMQLKELYDLTYNKNKTFPDCNLKAEKGASPLYQGERLKEKESSDHLHKPSY